MSLINLLRVKNVTDKLRKECAELQLKKDELIKENNRYTENILKQQKKWRALRTEISHLEFKISGEVNNPKVIHIYHHNDDDCSLPFF